MTKKEAAFYIGVTERTLQSYVSKGLLSVHYERTKRGLVASFDKEALDSFLSGRRKPPSGRKPKGSPVRFPELRFRMDPYDIEELEAEAKKVGMTVNEYARVLVREARDAQVVARVQASTLRTDELERKVELLRKEVADTVEQLLTLGGSTFKVTPEQARAWVQKNLR